MAHLALIEPNPSSPEGPRARAIARVRQKRRDRVDSHPRSRLMDALFTVDRVSSPDREERLIGRGEVARRLGVAPSTVASWVRQGWITPAVRTAGGRLRFRFSDVERQLRERGQGV